VTDALLVSNVLLWILLVGLALSVLALVRQVGLLHERLAPMGALATQRGPEVGEPAPELALLDAAGGALRIGGPDPDGRRTLLFFLSATCPVCKTLLPTLSRVAAAEAPGLRLVFASDGDPDEHAAFRAEHGLAERDYVLSMELGLRFQVAKLPYAVLIDERGIVRAKGLVNTREHLESLFEAHQLGVGSIQEFLERERGHTPLAQTGALS